MENLNEYKQQDEFELILESNTKYVIKKFQTTVNFKTGGAGIKILYNFYTKFKWRVVVEFMMDKKMRVHIKWYKVNRNLEYIGPIQVWGNEVKDLFDVYQEIVYRFFKEHPGYTKFTLD